MTKKILITGATGYLGTRLLKSQSAESPWVAHCLTRGEPPANLPGIVWHRIPERDNGRQEALLDLFSKMRFDGILHLATHYTTSDEGDELRRLLDSNLQFGAEVLLAMRSSGCRRLLNITTHAEFDENGDYRPNSLYASTKRAFRDLCRYDETLHALGVIDLVLYDNYGPHDPRRKVIHLLKTAAESGEALQLSPGEQRLNLVYVEDTVAALRHAMNHLLKSDGPVSAEWRLCGVSHERSWTLRELAGICSQVFGKPIAANWGARPYRPGEIMSPFIAPRLPGWLARTSLKDGLKLILEEESRT